MNRRTLLTTGGLVLGSLSAGCIGGSSDDGAGANGTTEGTGSGRSAPASPTPASASMPTVGDSIVTKTNLKLSLDDVVTTDEMALKGTSGFSRIQSDEDTQFLIAKVQILNNSSSARPIPAPTDIKLRVQGDRFVRTHVEPSGPFRQPITGSRSFQETDSKTLEPGATASAWIPFDLPFGATDVGLTIPQLAPIDGEPPVEWLLPAPESTTVSFETNLSGPSDPVQGKEATYTLRVRNVGERAGQFVSNLAYSGPGETSTTVSVVVEPGAAVERSLRPTPTALGEFSVSCATTADLSGSINAPTYPLGETWTASNGLEVTVENVTVTDTLTGVTDFYTGETSSKTASSGFTYVVAHVTARNSSNQSLALPENFVLRTEDNGSIGDTYLSFNSLTAPGSGDIFSVAMWNSYGTGDSESGWIAFEVPDSFSKPDAAIFTSTTPNNRKMGAKWPISSDE